MSTPSYEASLTPPTPGMVTPELKSPAKSPPPIPGVKRAFPRSADPRIQSTKRLIEKSFVDIDKNLKYMFDNKKSDEDFELLKDTLEYIKTKAEEFEHQYMVFAGRRKKRSTRRMKKF